MHSDPAGSEPPIPRDVADMAGSANHGIPVPPPSGQPEPEGAPAPARWPEAAQPISGPTIGESVVGLEFVWRCFLR